ncbi:hypothetical protein [Nonomuraea sp. NPDC046570]|uniref:hypothetical protein n=1 Tax=Nonomuraea sp. NPDC046570 TaxID=3155255 RepID=UPI0033FF0646
MTQGFHAELERARQDADAAVFGAFAPEELARLALLPEWPMSLALRLPLSPPGRLPELLAGLRELELIESAPVLRADGTEEISFWVRESSRSSLGSYLRRHHHEVLDAQLRRLREHLTEGVDLPAWSPAWLSAATEYHDDPSGLSLLRDATPADDDLLPDAARLVATVKSLGEVVGGHLADSARRAGWRVAQAGRRLEDVHFLRHYHPRAEIEAAIRSVLFGSSGTWAVHLLGLGGVGKTMLIRRLSSGGFARGGEAGEPTVARVDFDHIDPRYPEDRPGEMLLALAVDLLGHAGTREADARYRRFLHTVERLHEGLSRLPHQEEPLLVEMVAAFARFVEELPAPVVLVLDTCEEMAKLYPPGAPAPAIEMTFRMLEMLHERAPAVRVILAGRRPLSLPPERAPAVAETPAGPRPMSPLPGVAPGGPALAPRPYLRVVPVTGFTRAEAEEYLERRGVPVRLRAALLERSLSETCHSPFDLACYTDWALGDPDFDPAELSAATGDPYVERRIVARINDPGVVRCLAVAAELGRFDRALVRAEFERLGVDPGRAFEGLADQEWVRVVGTAEGRPALIEVDENLRDRLRAVTAADRPRFPLHAGRLGHDAAALVAAAPSVSGLPAATVTTAVRLLPPQEAAHLWQSLEERVVEEDAWGWAEQIASRVSGEEGARAESGTPSVMAAVLATQAAARIHTGRGGVARLWRQVERLADRHPLPATARVLAARAILGRAAAGDHEGVDLPAVLPSIIACEGVPGGSVAAAVEGWMARGGDDASWRRFTPEALAEAPVAADARVHLLLQAALIALRTGDPRAKPWAIRALLDTLAAEDAEPPAASRWADWIPPGDLLRRCNNVLLLVSCVQGDDSYHLDHAVTDLSSIEQERQQALQLWDLHGRGTIPDPELAALERWIERCDPPRPSAWHHRQIPPLLTVVAQACAVGGNPYLATAPLRRRLDSALTSPDQSEVVEECQRALLWLCRRTRDMRHLPSALNLAMNGPPLLRAEAWITLTLVEGLRPADPEEAGSWYGWWQCQDLRRLSALPSWPPPAEEEGIPAALSEESAREYAELFPGSKPPEPVGALLALDLDRHPGTRGRALLAWGEVLALRFPERAVAVLWEAMDLLAVAEDLVHAGQARVLAGLARRRAEVPAALSKESDGEHETPWEDQPGPATIPLPSGSGWRHRVIGFNGGFSPSWNSPELHTARRSARERWLTSRRTGPRRLTRALGTALIVLSLLTTASLLSLLLRPETAPMWRWLAVTLAAVTAIGAGALLPVRLRHRTTAATLTLRRTDTAELELTETPLSSMVSWGPLWGGYLEYALALFRPQNPEPLRSREPLSPDGTLRLRLLPRPRLKAVCLDVEPTLEHRDWEQWLGRALPPDQPDWPIWFRRAHTVPGFPQPPEGSEHYFGPSHLNPPLPSRRPALLRSMLRHLVGTPLETADGWRLRVGTDSGFELIGYSDVALHDLALVVLQADPVDGWARPLGEDRRGFVGFARDLMRAGARSVIIVPPLPDAAARAAIGLCREAALTWRSRHGTRNHLALLRRLRELVTEAEEPDGGDRAAFDLIMFLPAETYFEESR